MTKMLEVPRDRPRRSHWQLPVLLGLTALLYLGIFAIVTGDEEPRAQAPAVHSGAPRSDG